MCVVRSFLNPGSPRVEQYTAALLVAFMAAVVLAPLILSLYRRRVVHLMARPDGMSDAPEEPSGSSAPPAAPAGDKEFPEVEALKLASRERAQRLARSLRITALIFTLTTVVMSLALKWQSTHGSHGAAPEAGLVNAIAWSFAAVFWTLLVLGTAWPIVILGTANPRFVRGFGLVTLPCLVLLLAMPIINSTLERSQLTGYLLLVAIVALLCLGLVPRHMRNVVPTLTLALSLAVIAWIEADNLTRGVNTCLGWLPIRDRAGAWRAAVFLVVVLTAMLLGAFFGIYRMLRAVASGYRNKRFSDAQLQALFWYGAVAGPIAAAIYASQRGPQAPPMALVIGVSALPTAIAYAWLTRRLPAPYRPSVTLLLLRVFGRTRRGERLLDRVAASWRFIGPVFMIGGPDLAQASLEPHELAAFLSGGLKQDFVADLASLERTLADIDLDPDPDRRYRVNEVYCAGDIWTRAAQQLIERSAIVLIDLSEFHAGRQGTATELAMLARLGALSRTIAVVSKATDLQAVNDAMNLSPSPTRAQSLRTLSIEDKADGEELFARVIAARSAAKTQG